MGAGIQRLTRVHEYVGDLVLLDDGYDFEESPAPLSLSFAQRSDEDLVQKRSLSPKSTAGGTTMVNSSQSSSLMTIDTPSSITLETMDSEPPGYSR